MLYSLAGRKVKHVSKAGCVSYFEGPAQLERLVNAHSQDMSVQWICTGRRGNQTWSRHCAKENYPCRYFTVVNDDGRHDGTLWYQNKRAFRRERVRPNGALWCVEHYGKCCHVDVNWYWDNSEQPETGSLLEQVYAEFDFVDPGHVATVCHFRQWEGFRKRGPFHHTLTCCERPNGERLHFMIPKGSYGEGPADEHYVHKIDSWVDPQDGRVDKYEGKQHEERKVDTTFSDGTVVSYRGNTGAEYVYQIKHPHIKLVLHFEGNQDNEHLVGVTYLPSAGTASPPLVTPCREVWAGEKHGERMTEREYTDRRREHFDCDGRVQKVEYAHGVSVTFVPSVGQGPPTCVFAHEPVDDELDAVLSTTGEYRTRVGSALDFDWGLSREESKLLIPRGAVAYYKKGSDQLVYVVELVMCPDSSSQFVAYRLGCEVVDGLERLVDVQLEVQDTTGNTVLRLDGEGLLVRILHPNGDVDHYKGAHHLVKCIHPPAYREYTFDVGKYDKDPTAKYVGKYGVVVHYGGETVDTRHIIKVEYGDTVVEYWDSPEGKARLTRQEWLRGGCREAIRVHDSGSFRMIYLMGKRRGMVRTGHRDGTVEPVWGQKCPSWQESSGYHGQEYHSIAVFLGQKSQIAHDACLLSYFEHGAVSRARAGEYDDVADGELRPDVLVYEKMLRLDDDPAWPKDKAGSRSADAKTLVKAGIFYGMQDKPARTVLLVLARMLWAMAAHTREENTNALMAGNSKNTNALKNETRRARRISAWLEERAGYLVENARCAGEFEALWAGRSLGTTSQPGMPAPASAEAVEARAAAAQQAVAEAQQGVNAAKDTLTRATWALRALANQSDVARAAVDEPAAPLPPICSASAVLPAAGDVDELAAPLPSCSSSAAPTEAGDPVSSKEVGACTTPATHHCIGVQANCVRVCAVQD